MNHPMQLDIIVTVNGHERPGSTPHTRAKGDTGTIDYIGEPHHNLPYIDVRFPYPRENSTTELFFPEEITIISVTEKSTP